MIQNMIYLEQAQADKINPTIPHLDKQQIYPVSETLAIRPFIILRKQVLPKHLQNLNILSRFINFQNSLSQHRLSIKMYL